MRCTLLKDMGKIGIQKGNKKERELSLVERSYLPALLSGLAYTLKQMFRKKQTIEYPEEPANKHLGPEFRGRPVLVEENGTERCVACGLCARVCPPLAISMQASETDNPKERYPVWFEIDMLRCIYCGLCEEVCPEEAIVMSPFYDFVFTTRESAVMTKEKLLVPKEELKDRLEFLAKYRNPNYNKNYKFKKSNNIHSLKDQHNG